MIFERSLLAYLFRGSEHERKHSFFYYQVIIKLIKKKKKAIEKLF